jgi:NAD+ diphosphatase
MHMQVSRLQYAQSPKRDMWVLPHIATITRVNPERYANCTEKIALGLHSWHLGEMKIAETVTFGGSGLNRAAELRGQAGVLAAQKNACAILLWRGKPMIAGDKLVRVPLDHPVMADASKDIVLLGLEEDAPTFAADLSEFTPADLDGATLEGFLDPSEQAHPAYEGGVFAELRAIMSRLSVRDAELAATAKAVIGWHISHRFCARCGAESTLAMAGWQRDCEACGGHHFPRTDPVVIMLITHGNSVLVGRSPGWPEGMYSLLAGFVEPGETIEAAVRREVFEEAGVQVGQVTYLSSQPWPFPASLMIGCAGEALNTKLVIDANEIEDAMWVTREDIALAYVGNHPKLRPARKGSIAHFLLEAWLSDRLD